MILLSVILIFLIYVIQKIKLARWKMRWLKFATALSGTIMTYEKCVYDSPEDAEDGTPYDETVGNSRLK